MPVKRLALALLALCGSLNAAYTSSTTFTFNVHPASSLTAFPNLISGTYAIFADVAHGGYVQHTVTLNGQTVPADLIFTSDSGGNTLLSWEVESWDNTNGKIVVWVKSDRSSSADTPIYAWVGNASVTTYQCTASATWDTNYKGVWHLPNGTGLTAYDSTSSGNNGTPSGNAPIAGAGKVDGGAFFDAPSNEDFALNPAIGFVGGAGARTVSIWANASSNSQAYSPIFTYGANVANELFGIFNDSGTLRGVTIGTGDLAVSNYFVGKLSQWHHFTLTYNGSSLALYVDGTIVAGPASAPNVNTILTVASLGLSQSNVDYWTGGLDEARISNLARSADWIAHEFAQQNNPTSMYTVASSPTLSISGCSSGSLRVASATCTVTLANATFDGAHSVVVSDGGSGGTITPSVGSPGVSTVTVTPTSGTTFTFTYTPNLVGNIGLSLANAYGWANPSVLSYASSRSNPCTMTAKADGNWASASTWTASGGSCDRTTPDTGDTVAITAFHVTVPSSTTAYVGSCPANNTTYDLTIAPTATTDATSGVLEVAGTLWLCGNVKLNASALANPAGLGVLQIDTGGALKWDLNNGSMAYRLVPGVTGGWNRIVIGTAGDTCTFATESCPSTVLPVNVGSANPILVDTNGTTDSMIYQIYGALVKNCGSTSIGCLNYATDATDARNSYANAGLVDIEGSVFDTTGGFQGSYENNPSSNNWWTPVLSLTVKETRFINDLMGFGTWSQGGVSSGWKPCTVTNDYFSMAFGRSNQGWGNCTFTGDVFASGMVSYGSIAGFQSNVTLVQEADSTFNIPAIQNNYFSWPTAGSSAHNVELPGTAMSQSYIGNVHESLDSSQGEGHCTTGSGGNPSYKRILLDNLSLAAPNGVNTCSLGGGISTYPGGGSDAISFTDHNGAYGLGVIQWFNINGHSGGYYATNQNIRSLRANLGYASSVGSGNLMIAPDNLETSYLNAVPNTGSYVPQEGGNSLWNAAASTHWGPGNGNSGCNSTQSGAYGTPYDQCTASGTTIPGIADITANPKLLDPSRKLFTWASRLHGQTASLAGAKAAFIGCPNLNWCITQLVSWVRRGYQPTNLALKGKAYDGRIVGFTGTYGSGYTGTCSVTITPRDTDDLGYGAAAMCSFVSGVPAIQVTNPGMHYRIATPATVAIGGTCTGGCVAASLTPAISPHDIGPVQMALIPGVM